MIGSVSFVLQQYVNLVLTQVDWNIRPWDLNHLSTVVLVHNHYTYICIYVHKSSNINSYINFLLFFVFQGVPLYQELTQ